MTRKTSGMVATIALVAICVGYWVQTGWKQPLANELAPSHPAPAETKLEPPIPTVSQEISLALSEKQVDGFPESIEVRDGDATKTLVLTGQFKRVKPILIVKLEIYEIASYTEAPIEGSAESLLADLLRDGKPKVYLLRFLRNLSGRQIIDAINEEVNVTFIDVDLPKLRPDIDRFIQVFQKGGEPGATVYMGWLNGGRFYCSFAEPKQLTFVKDDVSLARAIWRIWCGADAGPERVGLVRRFVR